MFPKLKIASWSFIPYLSKKREATPCAYKVQSEVVLPMAGPRAQAKRKHHEVAAVNKLKLTVALVAV